MTLPLEGRTALVTGAARNIGAAIARALARDGAAVGLHAHTRGAEAEGVAAQIRGSGGRAHVSLCDLRDPAAIASMTAEIADALGPPDVLVSNAATRPAQSLLEISPEDWNDVLGTNLSAPFHCARALLPSMVERGFGRIIHIGGPDGQRPMARRAHNVTAKAGLIGLTKAIALEFGRHGITANVVVPGITDTIRAPGYRGWPPSQELLDRELAIPRLGRSEEIAEACAFLATERAAYVTGQTLHVSGGYYMP